MMFSKCSVCVLAGGDRGFTNILFSAGVECMHMDDLGLVSFYVVKSTEGYLKSKYRDWQERLKSLNNRMHLVPRADGDFCLPFCNGQYFCEHSNVQAKEHRNVLQVLPHLFHGIDEQLTELSCW